MKNSPFISLINSLLVIAGISVPFSLDSISATSPAKIEAVFDEGNLGSKDNRALPIK